MLLTVVVIIALFCNKLFAIDLPPVPCPHIFKYEFDGQKYVGIIKIRGVSYGEMTIKVDMTQPGHVKHDYSGQLSLATNKDKVGENIALSRPITFRIEFPGQNILPRITDIAVNNAKICFDAKRGGRPGAARTAQSAITLKHTLIVNTPTSAGSAFNFDRLMFLRPPFGDPAGQPPTQYKPTTTTTNSIQGNPFLSGAMSRFTGPPASQPTPTTTTIQKQMDGNPFLNGVMSRFGGYPSPPPPTTTTTTTVRPMHENPFLNGAMSRFGGYPSPPPPTTTTTTTVRPMEENPFLSRTMNRLTDPPAPPPITTTTTTVKPIYASEDDRYNNLYWVCGRENDIDVRGLVVHGKPLPRSRFPWIVAIYTINREFMKFRCGGSLISKRTVISAAHCFKEGFETIKASELLLSIGRHNLSDWDNAINILVEQVIIHPDFRKQPSNMDADVAIVHLKESVKFSFTVRPICLWQGPPDDSSIEGTTGSLVGWGEDEAHKGISNIPRIVNATIVSEKTCMRSNDKLYYLTSNRTLCAGNKDGSGPCKGDSGSGLMLRIGNKWMLRALVSTALTNKALQCNLDEYVIYSDVAKFITWIKSYMLM